MNEDENGLFLIIVGGCIVFGLIIGVFIGLNLSTSDEHWHKILIDKGYAEYQLDKKTGEVKWDFIND